MPSNNTVLRISPIPFRSSLLSIPPSPFSPRTPLTPEALGPSSPRTQAKKISPSYQTLSVSPPTSPLRWVWTCHQCHQSYHIGTTRRCLEDGHNFCSGTTIIRTWRQATTGKCIRRNRACVSEFDYQGWKAWGRWRRGGLRRHSAVGSEDTRGCMNKNCWNLCDYPSECRWGKEFGVHTPVEPGFI